MIWIIELATEIETDILTFPKNHFMDSEKPRKDIFNKTKNPFVTITLISQSLSDILNQCKQKFNVSNFMVDINSLLTYD